MLLAIDVGNTNSVLGVFEGTRLLDHWRVETHARRTSDEYGILMANLFAHNGVSMKGVEGIIMSSVVPTVNFTLEHMCRNYFGMGPMFVGPGIKTGINIKYDNPRELGGDRIANAVAAYAIYGGPCITIDFGTATTFGALSAKGEFLGGAICPGMKLAAEALTEHAAKLPRFELAKPETVIGRNTITNLQAGIVYGYVGQVMYLVKKFREELKAPSAKVIATGGLALLVADETDSIDVLDGVLTLKGLRILYERNVA
jgi:type III pantothenate kinase